ncbi:MAG TPA: hypothetical protein PKA90_08235 [Ignavibacteria bacterium]|nr:hypothetical protein [Ignavibacteria bacterium]HMR40406.1 hypothetical protein [Ignavibacteria bacterium]
MKFCIRLIFFFLIIYQPEISVSQDKEELIEIIREELEDIHLDTSLRSITLINEEFLQNMTDGGGELTGFYNEKSISKIYRSIGISNGVMITEFYYKKSKLIFIREKFNSYVYDDVTGSFDYTKINTAYSGSYYFKEGEIFNSSVKGKRNFGDENNGIQDILKKESSEAVNLISKSLNEVHESK